MTAHPLARWLAPLLAEVPDVAFFDAHTHIGSNDPDGATCSSAQLLAMLEPLDARAVVFPMHEPGGYPPANDRIIAEARASNGRLVPFCRLDPAADAVTEARRCVDGGARGIKLHPRAEAFDLGSAEAREIFAFAHELRLPVLIHAGRGIPALGAHALALAQEFPEARIILAHAAISDLSWLWRHLPAHRNVFVDSSWWNPVDLLMLVTHVPPGQVLFASDAPYGGPALGAVLLLRCAIEARLTADQMRCLAGAQLEQLLAGGEPLDAGPAPGPPTAASDLALERVFSFLLVALGRAIVGASGHEAVALTRLAAAVDDCDPVAPTCAVVRELLDAHERLMAEVPPEDLYVASRTRARALAPLLLAAVLTKTPRAGLPASLTPA
jgi:hypothetical protein